MLYYHLLWSTRTALEATAILKQTFYHLLRDLVVLMAPKHYIRVDGTTPVMKPAVKPANTSMLRWSAVRLVPEAVLLGHVRWTVAVAHDRGRGEPQGLPVWKALKFGGVTCRNMEDPLIFGETPSLVQMGLK